MNKGNRKKQHERYYKKNKVHDRNKYIKYTDLECKWILEHNTTDVEFARMIGKSLMAIQCKRVRLNKKVDPPEFITYSGATWIDTQPLKPS